MTDEAAVQSLNDRALRKAWLKQHFASFDYHEQLLRLHRDWKSYIKQALSREEVGRRFPEQFRFFTEKAIPNFDREMTPGQLDPDRWQPGASAGAARSIGYYMHDTGLDNDFSWAWLTEADRNYIWPLFARMQQMCTNIRRTVDRSWERTDKDTILNERYTGPISWPADWKRQLLGDAATLLDASAAVRVKAGERVDESGTYQALDARDRRFSIAAGDRLPDLGSAYGTTVWQRIGD